MIHARLAVLLALPLLLASCLLSPGKFVSSLDIRKDRSFTFSYVGEVIMLDPSEGMTGNESTEEPSDQSDGADSNMIAADAGTPPQPTAEQVAQRKAVAEALSKEVGYRSVEYLGGNKFRVDYQMTGRLDRSFVYPINIDAMALVPWIAIEVRKDGTVRMKALAFGENDAGSSMGAMAGMGKEKAAAGEPGREGTFTLTTDASLVMQNNEEGTAPGPGTKVVWRVTPTSKTVPTAVIRF